MDICTRTKLSLLAIVAGAAVHAGGQATVELDGTTLRIVGRDDIDPSLEDKIEVVSDGSDWWVRPIGTVDPSFGQRFPKNRVDLVDVLLRDGNDIFDGSQLTVRVEASGGRGNDTITTGSGGDVLFGGPDDDMLSAGSGDDEVYGGDGGDTIFSGAGRDKLFGFQPIPAFADDQPCIQDQDHIFLEGERAYVEGGPDNDRIETIGMNQEFTVIYGYAPNPGSSFLPCFTDADTILVDAMGVFDPDASPFSPFISGGPDTDTIATGGFNDVIFGDDGDDIINAGDGDDVVFGGLGNDTLDGDKGFDAISGDEGNDTIRGGLDDDRLDGGPGSDTIFGQAGNDVLIAGVEVSASGTSEDDDLSGGSGDDRLYSDAGADVLEGGADDDLLVGLDQSTDDTLRGGLGTDSYWIDRRRGERDTVLSWDPLRDDEEETLHEVRRFSNDADWTWDGDSIADPEIRGDDAANFDRYENFGHLPLFGPSGPVLTNVDQGSAGNCWLLAALSSMAHARPSSIREAVIPLADHTFLVELGRRHYRVDADLPVNQSGTPLYAGVIDRNGESSLWVAVIEKAVGLQRFGLVWEAIWTKDNYADTESGFPRTAFRYFDGNVRSPFETTLDLLDPATLLTEIDRALTDGKCVAIGTRSNPVPSLVENHAYVVVGLTTSNGTLSGVELYNPWGFDGTSVSDGLDDGFVVVTGQELQDSLRRLVPIAVSVNIADFTSFPPEE
ncbi:MAG: C2 family cysteine protease [Phycisphaerales bacterium]